MKVHGNSTKLYQQMPDGVPIIDFNNVTKNYVKAVPAKKSGIMTKNAKEEVAALNGINLQIQKGEFVFIVGPSGSGKSTLIKLLLKELEPTTGEIKVKNKPIKKISRKKLPTYRRDIGVVFQDFRLLPDRTVYENVAFAQQVIEAPSGLIKHRVPAVLSEVYLLGKDTAYPNELSGGEQQRVAIARALVNQPTILLCDEPTGNLDPENSNTVMKILEHANKMGTTVVVVTHNMEIVQQMRKRTITMSQGKIIKEVAKGGYFYED
jgi:cell division transport system ATP-binding protein